MRHIGNAGQQAPQLLLSLVRLLLQRFTLFAQSLVLLHLDSSILAGFLQASNFLRGAVSLRLEGFRLRNQVAAAPINIAKISQHLCGIETTVAQHFFYPGKIVADVVEIEHRSFNLTCWRSTQHSAVSPLTSSSPPRLLSAWSWSKN